MVAVQSLGASTVSASKLAVLSTIALASTEQRNGAVMKIARVSIGPIGPGKSGAFFCSRFRGVHRSKNRPLMSALGQKQTSPFTDAMSALPPKAASLY
jgi:hypothetical protein